MRFFARRSILCFLSTPPIWSVIQALPALAQGATNPPEAKAITPAELATMMKALGAQLIVVDVREPVEFAVSRLRGARHVGTATETKDFVKSLGPAAKGATIAFYCTYGGRSGPYAQMAQDDLKAAGAKNIFTLKGGIIAWANERRPLVDAKGATPYVHTYDAETAKQLTKPALARFEPRT
jgi:rhodanese-related sulfurtransferase